MLLIIRDTEAIVDSCKQRIKPIWIVGWNVAYNNKTEKEEKNKKVSPESKM